MEHVINHLSGCKLSGECLSADDHDVCIGDVIDNYVEFCVHCAWNCTCQTLLLLPAQHH